MEHAALTVLVVDDDEAARLYLAIVLRKNGFAVLEAPDGAAAIKIMRERDKEIAAVISDIRMPNIDGLKLAELNYQNGFLPFIACTMISDAAAALTLLKFGVRDYVVKPVEETVLVNTVRDAIGRRNLPRLFADDETPLPGNMGVITISARFAAVHRARGWLELKASGIMSPVEQRQFLAFASEFLMNAYEHGSLMLTEEEKSALLESGGYHDELRRRELECKAKIEVAVSIVGNEIAISVTDPGYGFDYKRYQEMSEAEMLDRLIMPNGRGIQMAMQYFDSITFSKGGAGVLLTKKMPKG
ncbi:MAG: response regulator [Nitrospinae bacterium]|nr:response regulator [Nitrospinota bacterium]